MIQPRFPLNPMLDPRLRYAGYDGDRVLNIGAGINPIIGPGTVNHDVKEELGYINFDVTKPPWPVDSESFDKVLAFHIIEHIEIEQVNSFLQECWRVLVMNGALIMECPDIVGMAQELVNGNQGMLRYIYSYNRTPGDSHRFGYTAGSLGALVCANGFKHFLTKPGTDYHSLQMPTVRIEAIKG